MPWNCLDLDNACDVVCSVGGILATCWSTTLDHAGYLAYIDLKEKQFYAELERQKSGGEL